MSVARGILGGFIKESLDQKAARDEFYADLAVQAGIDVRENTNLFRKEEDNIEKRFALVKANHGINAALYASYNKILDTDAGAKMVIDDLKNDPKLKKQIEEFDFQNYNFNTDKSQRFMDFNAQQKKVLENLGNNQFPVPVAELTFKDMQTGTQINRPELDLPPLSSGEASTAISSKDMMAYRKAAFAEFKSVEKDEFIKEFKDNFSKDYDPEKHGPSKDLYGFERYFNEFYLPGIVGNKTTKTMDTQMQNMTGTGTTTETGSQTTDASTTPTPFEGDIVDYSSDNPQYFSYNGKLYNVPERFIKKTDSDPKAQEMLNLQNQRRGTNFTLPEFTVQSLPEITKKAIAAQQDKEPITKNNPNVLAAQQTINIIKAQNPNDPRIEDIKRDLRLILGVTNLDGLIS